MTISIRGSCLGRAILWGGLLAMGAGGTVLGAVAEDLPSRASLWARETQADTRLVAAVTSVAPDARTLDLGWQVALKGNWKTYWRSPGDAGLPPHWDWSGSTNVAAVTVGWPAPERITLFGLDSYVYTRSVVLPLRVRLKTPGQAADLRLKVAYMVCEEVCVPLEAQYRLYVPAGPAQPAADARLIRQFESLIPRAGGEDAVTQVAFDPNCGKPRIELALAPDMARGGLLDAYVDGPDGVTYGRPRLAADGRRLTLPVRGLAAGDARAAAPIYVVLRPAKGATVAWQGTPAPRAAQQTCLEAGS